jgi:hypothetical protein
VRQTTDPAAIGPEATRWKRRCCRADARIIPLRGSRSGQCSRGPPRCEFVFQPKYMAYVNLIEPWQEVGETVERATAAAPAEATPRRRHRPRG